MDNSDKLILKQLKSGNEKAFNSLFNEFYIPLCLFSNTYMNDIDKARSLVQEVFVRLWLNRKRLSINKSLKSYLFSSVKNATLDYLKHVKVEQEYINQLNETAVDEKNIQDLMETSELEQKISKAIEALPDKSKQVFKMSKIEGLKYVEIAQKLNVSVKTVEMHMGNALKKLRSQLSENLLLLYLHLKNIKKIQL